MRIAEKSLKNYSWPMRFVFWLQKKKYGRVLEPTKMWGRSPKLYFAFTRFYAALTRKSSPIDPVIRSLINTYISQLNHCAFCIDLNASFLQRLDISMEKILQLSQFNTSHLFSDKERIVLKYAAAITQNSQQIDNELIQQLHQYYDDDAIVELTAMIAFQNLSSKFNAALDVPSQNFCQIDLNNKLNI